MRVAPVILGAVPPRRWWMQRSSSSSFDENCWGQIRDGENLSRGGQVRERVSSGDGVFERQREREREKERGREEEG